MKSISNASAMSANALSKEFIERLFNSSLGERVPKHLGEKKSSDDDH